MSQLAQLRIVPAPPYQRFVLEARGPGEADFRPYVYGTSADIDSILAELEPGDGELVSDCRKRRAA